MKLPRIMLLTLASLFLFSSNSSCNGTSKNTSAGTVKDTTPLKSEESQQTEKVSTNLEKKDYSGIYVATDWQKPIPDYVFKNPDVDGIIIRLYWADLQPSYDKFDWNLLDVGCKQATSAGKKIWITLAAGKHSPEWIYQHHVRKLSFTESPQEGKSEKMIPVDVPVVWDKDYVVLWKNLLKNLAEHLKSDKSTWDAITMMKIAGINERTDEIRLPAQNELSTAKGKSSNAPKIWQSSGYKPDLVFNIWKQILDAYAEYFPGKILSMAIIPGHAFPTIDKQGNVVDKKQTRDLTLDMIDDGITRYKGIFAVQFNSLRDNGGANELVVKAGKRGAITGFQLNHIKLADPPCLDDHSKCDENMFHKVMDNGIKNGASWIEIFPKNVLAYPEAIKYGHNELLK